MSGFSARMQTEVINVAWRFGQTLEIETARANLHPRCFGGGGAFFCAFKRVQFACSFDGELTARRSDLRRKLHGDSRVFAFPLVKRF